MFPISSDFPKALWTCTAAQLVLFCAVGVTIYKYTGIQYMTSPAFGGLGPFQKIVSFSFMIPTIVILGAMYASITARFIFFRLFRESKHLYNHTVKGWSAWSGILCEMLFWPLSFSMIAGSGLLTLLLFTSGYLGARIHHIPGHSLFLSS